MMITRLIMIKGDNDSADNDARWLQGGGGGCGGGRGDTDCNDGGDDGSGGGGSYSGDVIFISYISDFS